jgi:hypothetical protein
MSKNIWLFRAGSAGRLTPCRTTQCGQRVQKYVVYAWCREELYSVSK